MDLCIRGTKEPPIIGRINESPKDGCIGNCETCEKECGGKKVAIWR